MRVPPNVWIALAALSGALAVGLGAWGAHGLRGRLEPEALASWQTAVQYHLVHSAALLALALHALRGGRGAGLAFALLAAGVLLFSGSVYVLALGGPRWLGPVTPLGGLALIAGWVAVLGALRGG